MACPWMTVQTVAGSSRGQYLGPPVDEARDNESVSEFRTVSSYASNFPTTGWRRIDGKLACLEATLDAATRQKPDWHPRLQSLEAADSGVPRRERHLDRIFNLPPVGSLCPKLIPDPRATSSSKRPASSVLSRTSSAPSSIGVSSRGPRVSAVAGRLQNAAADSPLNAARNRGHPVLKKLYASYLKAAQGTGRPVTFQPELELMQKYEDGSYVPTDEL